jgi:hypothetical protein
MPNHLDDCGPRGSLSRWFAELLKVHNRPARAFEGGRPEDPQRYLEVREVWR